MPGLFELYLLGPDLGIAGQKPCQNLSAQIALVLAIALQRLQFEAEFGHGYRDALRGYGPSAFGEELGCEQFSFWIRVCPAGRAVWRA